MCAHTHTHTHTHTIFISSAIYLSVDVDTFYAPPLLYVPNNERTTFYCKAVGSIAYWVINGTTVDDDGDIDLKKMGFTFTKITTVDRGNVHHNISLGVPAVTDHNNTVITCLISIKDNPVQSNTVKIIYMGELVYT